MSELKTVYIKEIIETNNFNYDGKMVKVDCPFCSQEHTHSWPANRESVGVRFSACRPGGRYLIKGE